MFHSSFVRGQCPDLKGADLRVRVVGADATRSIPTRGPALRRRQRVLLNALGTQRRRMFIGAPEFTGPNPTRDRHVAAVNRPRRECSTGSWQSLQSPVPASNPDREGADGRTRSRGRGVRSEPAGVPSRGLRPLGRLGGKAQCPSCLRRWSSRPGGLCRDQPPRRVSAITAWRAKVKEIRLKQNLSV